MDQCSLNRYTRGRAGWRGSAGSDEDSWPSVRVSRRPSPSIVRYVCAVSEALLTVVSSDTTPSYPWGTGCLGWHLVQGADFSVTEEEMPSGTAEVRHRHLHSRQFFYVLHGSLTIECDGVRHHLSVRSGIEVAALTAHQVRNESDGEVGFLVFSQPPTHNDREVAER